MTDQSILWRRLNRPGHDAARLFSQDSLWHLVGTAVFAQNQQPCRLDYHVVCNAAWRTVSGKVAGRIGPETVEIDLAADAGGRRRNGVECGEVVGCIDLDLAFTPCTNLIPIRRLDLAVGQEARVRAAWLRFPEFTLEPLDQLYRRIDLDHYRYESGSFCR